MKSAASLSLERSKKRKFESESLIYEDKNSLDRQGIKGGGLSVYLRKATPKGVISGGCLRQDPALIIQSTQPEADSSL